MHSFGLKSLVFVCSLAMASSAFALRPPGGGGGDDNGNGGGSNPPPASCPTSLPDILPQGSTAFFQQRPGVPSGNVEQVNVRSGLSRVRFHIYTPPGYDRNRAEGYPTLYLLHGAGQDDSNWSSRETRWGGSADLILDNLIAEGRIEPMVVMPNTSRCASQSPTTPGSSDACTGLFKDTIMPHVESNYNVIADRDHRAIAGLSQGGFVVFNTGFANLDLFSHFFSYGSGWFATAQSQFERNFRSILQDPATNSRLNTPFYMAAGYDDIAYGNTQATLDILNRNGIRTLTQEHQGGHDMDSFRRHLHQTLPVMFVNTGGCGS